MAWRWKARSVVPGEPRWTDAAVAMLFAEQHAADAAFLDVHKSEIIYIDPFLLAEFGVQGGAAGTGPATSALGGYEQKPDRRAWIGIGHYYQSRVYEVPFNDTVTLPLAGSCFPDELSGPRIVANGITTSPSSSKQGPPNLRITIVASAPLYTNSTEGKSFQYNL